MMTALLFPAVAGFAALGTETGLWFYTHQTMQGAADAAAFSAAVAGMSGPSAPYVTQGRAVAARYGYVNGSSGTTVVVNRPPTSGAYAGQATAVEVVIQQPQQRLFSAVVTQAPLSIAARAVALSGTGTGCVLALNRTASVDISAMGNPQVVLNGCSLYDNSSSPTALTVGGAATISALSVSVVGGVSGSEKITTTEGIVTGASPIPDPYADVPLPSYTPGCSTVSSATLSPGVYCGLTIHGAVTMQPGLYVIDGGSFDVNATATLTGSGVTIVFTSSSGSAYPTVRINGGATVDLTAADDSTTGPDGFKALQGLVMYMDRNAPVGTDVRLNGGSTQNFGGAIYLPKANVTFTGGSSTGTGGGCLQLIADTIAFGGNADFNINCAAAGTRPIGAPTRLVE
jgi:hypothetical protein